MTRRARVDAELVRRGLARSRQQAAELIGAGRVSIDGMRRGQTGDGDRGERRTLIVDDADERVLGVARGAQADRRARRVRQSMSTDRRCLDAGASTGGFTEVLLDRGAREVVAVDVGYGQLAWSLRTDRPGHGDGAHQRPRAHRRRHRRAGRRGRRRPVVHLAGHGAARADRVRVSRRGYRSHGEAAVRGRQGPGGRRRRGLRPAAAGRGGARSVADGAPPSWGGTPSRSRPVRCPGPSGNVEYFLHLRPTARIPLHGDALAAAVRRAVEEGPQ